MILVGNQHHRVDVFHFLCFCIAPVIESKA